LWRNRRAFDEQCAVRFVGQGVEEVMSKKNLAAVESLDEIATAPDRAADLSPAARARLIGKAHTALAALTTPGITGSASAAGENWISVAESAKLLGYTKRWFYRNPNLPFIKRVSRRKLLINRTLLDRWLESRRS
jgi:hypothetical protein